MDVFYSDYISNMSTTFADICNFIGVPSVEPATLLLQQNPESLSDLILNYSDLKSQFEGTDYIEYFVD